MRLRYQVLLLLASVLFCYAPTWFNGMVYDDHVYVEANPLVSGPLNLRKIFTSPYPPESHDQGLYRPLLTLSFKINEAIGGFPRKPEAFSLFHFANTMAHAICVLLLLLLLRRLGIDRRAAFLGALLFAVHPALSEAVSWTVGRAEIGAAVWTLVAIHCWMSRPAAARVFGGVAWLAALLFKESAVMAPVLALLLWNHRPAAFAPAGRWTRIAGASALAAALMAYIGLRSIALPALVPTVTPFTGMEGTVSRIGTAIMVLWKYLLYVFVPLPLSVYHDIRPAVGAGDPRVWAAVVGWGVLIGLLWKWRARTESWRLGLRWWLAALLPVSNLIVPIGTIFGERFIYLPSMLLYAALAGWACGWVWPAREGLAPGRWRHPAALPAAATAIALLLGAVVTIRRTGDWRNDLCLWESAVRRYPDSFMAAAPYAAALARACRFDEAMEQVRKCEEGLKTSPEPYRKFVGPKVDRLHYEVQYGLDRMKYFKQMEAGSKLVMQGEPRAALKVFEAMALQYPQFSEAEESIADIYSRLGNDMGAIQHYQRAILIEPRRGVLFGKLAQTMVRLGAPNQAIVMYERSLTLDPRNPITNYNIAVLWNDIQQLDKAIYYMEKAVEAHPEFAAARINLASFYEKKGRKADALAQLQEALRILPENADAQKLMRKLTRNADPREEAPPSPVRETNSFLKTPAAAQPLPVPSTPTNSGKQKAPKKK